MYLREFDPWKSELCTCPQKYSLNPYTGCSHGCVYCYASSYIKKFFNCRIKPGLVEKLKREIRKLPQDSLISLSNTSDPYPPMEASLGITRKCLEIFGNHHMRVLIITKSSLVSRDIDILKNIKSAVTITVTTLKFADKLEPCAPPPLERFKALAELSKAGIPTGLRLDPVIPLLNQGEIESILKIAKDCGISHVTLSSFKPRHDSWQRLKRVFPDLSRQIEPMYFKEGTKKSNAWYLREEVRKSIILRARQICDSLSLTFSSCREGFSEINSASSCDGSHLIAVEISLKNRYPLLFKD